MEQLFKEIKLSRLLIIQLLLLTLHFLATIFFKSFSNILLIITLYCIPIMWLWLELCNLGSSLKILFEPIKSSRNEIVKSLTIIYTLMFSAFLCTHFLGLALIRPADIDDELLLSPQFIISTVFIAPIAEEIFFRGYVLNKEMLSKNINASIIISSLYSAILHGESCLNAFIIGYLFSIIYLKYRNLLLTIILHSLYSGSVAVAKYTLSEKRFPMSSEAFPYLALVQFLIFLVCLYYTVKFVKNAIPYIKKKYM